MKNLLLVFVGGGLGSVARYGLGLWLSARLGTGATLLANALACLVIGMVLAAYPARLSEGTRLLLAVGFCGGLSTFSTYAGELFAAFRRGDFAAACIYIAASHVLSLLAILAGWYLVQQALSRN